MSVKRPVSSIIARSASGCYYPCVEASALFDYAMTLQRLDIYVNIYVVLTLLDCLVLYLGCPLCSHSGVRQENRLHF